MIYEMPNLAGVDFINAFRSIPKQPSIDALDLSNCNLAAKNLSDIIANFAIIPPNIKTIYLNNNELFRLERKELLDVLRSIPDTVTALNLAGNKLNTKAGVELTELLRTMKPNIKTLGLGNNNLVVRLHNRNSSQAKISSTAALTHRARTNDRSTVNFFSRGDSLSQFTLPGATVEETYELNRPPEKAAATLAEAFKTMSEEITFLDLSFNRFYLLPGALLNKIIASLPISLSGLNFSGNELGTKRPNDKESDEEFSKKIKLNLIEAFKPLKDKSITSLDISQNELHNLIPADLIEVISSFPEHIKEMMISESDIAKFSSTELTELANVLHRHNKVLKTKDAKGILSGAIGSAEIIDKTFITDMFPAPLSTVRTKKTSAEANSRAVLINSLTREILASQHLSPETFTILLEYLNIRMRTPVLKTLTPRPQTLAVTASVTRTTPSTSPTASPATGSPPSTDLQLVVVSPSHQSAGGATTQKSPANKPVLGDVVTAATVPANAPIGSATKYQGFFPASREEENVQTYSPDDSWSCCS